MQDTFDRKKMGQRIKNHRKAKNLSLTAVAKEVGVAASTIQRYEQGQFEKIKMPVIEAIAFVLDVNPEYIILKTDDPTPHGHFYYYEYYKNHPERFKETPSKSESTPDISKMLNRVLKYLNSDGDVLFDGHPMSSDAKNTLKTVIELGLNTAKLASKLKEPISDPKG